MCNERTNCYYAAARGAAESLHCSGRHVEESAGHRCKRPVERLSVNLAEMPAVGKAGVADDLVEPTEATECRIHKQFSSAALGKIRKNDIYDCATFPQFVGNLLQRRMIATIAAASGVDQELVPRHGNPTANRSANTTRCTCYQCRQIAHQYAALCSKKNLLDYRSWKRRSQREKLTTSRGLL